MFHCNTLWLISSLFLLLSCVTDAYGQLVWHQTNDEGMMTFSSPKVTDLNGDGILDVVIGDGLDIADMAGFNRPATTPKNILFNEKGEKILGHIKAFDGKTGSQLWSISSIAELYSTPFFTDINKDGVQDVLMGGRLSQFYAINGKNGEIIWQFDTSQPAPDPRGWLQFYNPQVVKDCNQDGINDIVVTNGGYPQAPPNDKNRPAGRLLLLSGATGKVLAKLLMPDSAETYCSPVIYPGKNRDDDLIIWGSGGETHPGSLWAIRVKDLQNENPKGFLKILTNPKKGFMVPCVIADINRDKIRDIVVANFEGKIQVVNGLDFSLIWEYREDSCETYTCPAIGHFNNDSILDIATFMNIGTFPAYKKAYFVVIDGKNGELLYKKIIASQYTSPLAVNIDATPLDEIIFPEAGNIEHAMSQLSGSASKNAPMPSFFLNALYPSNWEIRPLTPKRIGMGFASTPCIADINNDGLLEVIYSYGVFSKKNPGTMGWNIERFQLNISKPPLDYWGGYMGLKTNGIFNR
jgi:outer membrane protein assembly factor BamB